MTKNECPFLEAKSIIVSGDIHGDFNLLVLNFANQLKIIAISLDSLTSIFTLSTGR